MPAGVLFVGRSEVASKRRKLCFEGDMGGAPQSFTGKEIFPRLACG
jgi:hypothetical protein